MAEGGRTGSSSRPGRTGTYLLLVDDNIDDVYLTTRSLDRSDFGLKMKVVSSGEAALAWIDECDELPSAILVSFRLPGMNGTELISKVREHARAEEVPLFLLTSSWDERDHVCGEDCSSGANDCLIKPLSAGMLEEHLHELGVLVGAGAA